MKMLRNLSLRNKLIIITLVPLGVLFYYLGNGILNDIADRDRIQRIHDWILETEAVSSVIHNLQSERGYSASYLTSNGDQDRDEMLVQREQTDKAILALKQLKYKTKKDTGQDREFLDHLPLLRSKVSGFGENTDSLYREYTVIIEALNSEVRKISQLVEDPEIKDMLNAHRFLLHGKEHFSQIRSRVKQIILFGVPENGVSSGFLSLKGRYEMSMENLWKTIPAPLLPELENIYSDPETIRLMKIVDSIYRSPAASNELVDEKRWMFMSGSYMNALKALEAVSIAFILDATTTRLSEVTISFYTNIAIALTVIVLIAILLFLTIRNIVSSIAEIRNAADRITKGEVDIVLTNDARDEIGNLAASFNEMINTTKQYASAAEIIGKGDYNAVVQVRGDTDVLGISLNSMKNNLHRLSMENEKRTWLLSGTSELNDRIRGEKGVNELAREIISHLTTYLDAQIGAIYIAEDGQLNLVGSYAFQQRKGNVNTVKVGEGLVGQSALEKNPIIYEDIPDNYVRISSGIGNSIPKNILVYPFLYEEKVKGVIEIGSSAKLTEIHMQFLDLVAENIGIAINSAQSRTQLQELLEETQQQAEELEAQQEELRQTNEELEEKTEMLEKSEAELKAQQEELQQTNEELEEKAGLLEEQKEKLEVSKIELETKARQLEITGKYKSEFLANMSHELRTPLNSILILAQLMAENKNKVLGKKEVDYAKNIHNSGSDLLNLINEILDLSKVEAGKIELDIIEVKMEDVLQSMRSTFQELAKSKSIDFKMNLAPAVSKEAFYSDKQRLEQVLRNLLSNAFKFTNEQGKITLNVDLASPDKTMKDSRLQNQEKVLSMKVSDTGIGISDSQQKIVFEAFQQADGSTKRKYGGTGLGLSISRELAAALGGEIHLESREGVGSTFTLYLPLEFDPANITSLEKTVKIIDKQSSHRVSRKFHFPEVEGENVNDDRYGITENDKVVLVMEDDEQFAQVILEFIRDRGYKGIIAGQGNVGLSLARYYRPDAIMLDMKMPVMDGIEVLKQLKNDPGLRHVPVQIISGFDHRKESLELGAFGFLKKPISKEEMQQSFDRIEEFVRKKLKKLLIVEDDKAQNTAIRELIGNGDVKSYSAYTGGEALKMMLKETFDCIIIDLGLPDMSGFDLLQKIKSEEKLKNTPVVVYTGKDLNREETRELNRLANTVVLKTAESPERLLDETILFLHRVESMLPEEKQEIIRKLHKTDEVLKDKKVLVVDDDIRNIYSLTNALEEEGVRCVIAENGKACLEMLKEQPDIDIVLMDVMMPEMDGYEATQEIRKIKRFARLPVIALTAKAMKGDREKCLDAGMSDYVAKPVNVDQLLSLMRVWLYQ